MAGFKNVIADFSARLPLFFGMKRSNDYKKQTGLTRALSARPRWPSSRTAAC